MAQLVLGPMLRYVDSTSAVVWVETDTPCRVEILGVCSPTFALHGHHYGLVELTDLKPGSSLPYTVNLDGEQAWPEPGSELPPSRIRTVSPEAPVRLLFGSCRTSAPHDAKHNLTHGFDVLRCFANELRNTDESQWPTTLILLGDQVYADEPPDTVLEFIHQRRGTHNPPTDELRDFDEFAELYRIAWIDPEIRWLLSTIPTAMITDDHDLQDDWNTSRAWQDRMARLPWWRQRVIGALGSYWIYQHLGNLSASERAGDMLLSALRDTDGDGGVLLDQFAERSYHQPSCTKFSYVRDFGQTRFVMLDSRCGRLLTPGKRAMMDDAGWKWFVEQVTGQYEHLVIGTSLPYLLPAGLHYLEAWNEAVCDGAWGDRAAWVGEQLRQGIDLEHWAAFRRSFEAVAHLLIDLVAGAYGRPPTSVGFLSGDVHYAYLALASLPAAAAGSATKVYQVVCSPIRNPLSGPVRVLNACASFVIAGLVGRALAKTARVPRSPFDWTVTNGPYFRNVLSTLEIDGERVDVRWLAPSASTDDPPPLQEISAQRIR
ncbi:MAG: alkaline phosphatase D family protein [Actinomycetota bacterium]|nr:alkaline phosphatase D family protein [Actinomycetota bacterium]